MGQGLRQGRICFRAVTIVTTARPGPLARSPTSPPPDLRVQGGRVLGGPIGTACGLERQAAARTWGPTLLENDAGNQEDQKESCKVGMMGLPFNGRLGVICMAHPPYTPMRVKRNTPILPTPIYPYTNIDHTHCIPIPLVEKHYENHVCLQTQSCKVVFPGREGH